MKDRKSNKYRSEAKQPAVVKEAVAVDAAAGGPMIRTQIYLSQGEYDFVQNEARRRQEPMAAVIRGFIDERMKLPDEAWTNNPMLEPTPRDPGSDSPEDAAINHDHYLYGSPKKWIKVKGQYVEAPPLPDDYYENRSSAEAYDRMLHERDESK